MAAGQPAAPPARPAATRDVLPSTPIGVANPTLAYNVYDVSGAEPVKLTKAAIAETTTVDPRIVWNEKRCYVVRTDGNVRRASRSRATHRRSSATR